jgi:hypothetical protein
MGNWEFIVRKQGGGQRMENYYKDASGTKEIVAKLTFQARVIRYQLGEDDEKRIDIESEQVSQILRVGVSCQIDLAEFLLK